MSHKSLISIPDLYYILNNNYQADSWWFNNNNYHIMIGLILAQNTKWENVLISLDCLSKNIDINPQNIINLDLHQLISYIKVSGFAQQKSQYLKNISVWYTNVYPTLKISEIRESLLKVKGVGPETCDSIMLYALKIPIFVIDNYTKRLMQRLGYSANNYYSLQQLFHQQLKHNINLFQNYHALIIEHVKEICLKIPKCNECPLSKYCERRIMS